MHPDLLNFQKKNNIKFKDVNILIKSFNHKSYDSINSNEKLEFLGDRVLGLVISKKLLEIYPKDSEGVLDKKLASLVNKKKCLEVAKSIDLDKFIKVGSYKSKNVKIEDKIIADCCEALIGAVFLDQGVNLAEKFILKIWEEHLNLSDAIFVDSKTKLQEYSLKKYKVLPIYKVIENIGPSHKPIFKVAVRLQNSKFINAKGYSKKDAEQNAAKLFLKNLGK